MSHSKTKILFLYSELAEYTIACFHELLNYDTEIHVVRWPVNPEAPFQFEISSGIHLYERNELDRSKLINLVKKIQPHIIVSSGWMDKDYVKTCRYFFGKIPTILTLDNHWTGSMKQKTAVLLAPFTILKTFSHAWVPGNIQKQYALKLGFPEHAIKTGFYSANTALYNRFYEDSFPDKQKKFPKVILYVGRYVAHKGIFEMWDAFRQIQETNPNEWELWCAGTGDEFPNKTEHPKIKHFGFVQPKQMGKLIAESGIYILPSRFEPWGVSVHEFAVAGFPLLLSKQVGAAEKFLQTGKNGFEFESGNVASVKNAMQKVFALDEQQLLKMGKQSHEIGMTHSPKIWAETLLSFLDN
ncbi:MAG: glycosyltransferase [Bacteroidetes bacterium]|nr:MAG: glycosyltransferase [Bacteroidota bacterium]